MPRRPDSFQRRPDNLQRRPDNLQRRPDNLQHHHDNLQRLHNDARLGLSRVPRPIPIHPVALEEELEIRRREIQKILAENHHLVDENVILQRDSVAAKDEIRQLSQVIPKIRAENDAHSRELIDRGLKLEAELHAVEPVRAQVVQLRAEARKRNALCQDLKAEIDVLTSEVKRLRTENGQLKTLRGDVDGIRKELAESRRNYELEKKANEELALQNQTLEKNLVSMARDLEKLRAEELIAGRRAHGLGAGVGGYGMLNSIPDARYPTSSFSDGFGGGSWGPYGRYGPSQDNYGPPRR